jgi:tetratricopeptide (TPR) repeat protein
MNCRLTPVLFLAFATLTATAKETAQPPANGAQSTPPAGQPAAEAKPAAPDAKPAGKDAQSAAPAEPARAKRFFEQAPYDIITLNKENDSAVLNVRPLEFPGRRMPDKAKRVGKFRVKLLDRPTEDYEVAWRAIENVEFFEELVLREANTIVADAVAKSTADQRAESERRFDEAFEYFLYLLTRAPDTPGLPEAAQDYLYSNSGALFLWDRVPEAFAILEELHRQNPEYQYRGGTQTVLGALEAVGQRLIDSYVSAGDYLGARMLLERLQRTYQDRLKIVASGRERLSGMAAQKRDEAAQHLAAKRLAEAHEVSREMLKIWPAVQGGRELVIEIARQFPLVVVGVSQPALEFDPQSVHQPAARRCGLLMFTTLVQYAKRGPEGGLYNSVWGSLSQSADRKSLVFALRPEAGSAGFTGYELSRQLLALATPGSPAYVPAWASLMSHVSLEDVHQVRVELRRPSLLPQAWLQVKMDPSFPQATRYRVASQTAGETHFEPLPGATGADEPAPVVVERYYAEPRKAIEDLRKGKLDMIDRLLTSDALRLRNDPAVVVGSYAFPSIHALVPNSANPFLGNRMFRRALVYGINREVVLSKGLLDRQKVEGAQVLSAPLPAGLNRDDPAAYAYDTRITPLPYDPVMSAILRQLAEQQIAAAAEKRKEPVPDLKELVLAYPAGEQPRFVCGQIQTQLGVVGVKCTLRELPPGQTLVPDGKFDLLYVELAMREPLVDVQRLFGPGGFAVATDPFVRLMLRQVDRAENWKEARDRLYELHRLLYEDVTLLPLWQMIDFFAYHRGLRGVQDRPISFYQDVEKWRIVPPAVQD